MNFPRFRKATLKDIGSNRSFAITFNHNIDPVKGCILCSEGRQWRISYIWEGKQTVGMFSKCDVYITA